MQTDVQACPSILREDTVSVQQEGGGSKSVKNANVFRTGSVLMRLAATQFRERHVVGAL